MRGVAVVDVVLTEIPDRQVPFLGVRVELNGERAVVWVGGDDGAEVVVEHPEPTLVLAAQDSSPDSGTSGIPDTGNATPTAGVGTASGALVAIRVVERMTDGALKMGPGTLYGAIKRLLTIGLVTEEGPDRSSAPIQPELTVSWSIRPARSQTSR